MDFITNNFSSLLVAIAATLFTTVFIFRKSKFPPNQSELGNCKSKNSAVVESEFEIGEQMTVRLNENGGEVVALERQTGASMMEQLVPEITTHTLSYLDYPSLCRLSMTNSLMRKAANDDNAWKALYHKDFTLEQYNLTPPNGWKAYYAATRAIVNVNDEFSRIVRERSLPAMAQLWLNADYVKCFHATGESFSGYNAVMEGWELAFSWANVPELVRDVRARVLADVAWVTMKAYVDMDSGPFDVSNIYEFHNGRWYMVHYHSSPLFINGVGDQQFMQA